MSGLLSLWISVLQHKKFMHTEQRQCSLFVVHDIVYVQNANCPLYWPLHTMITYKFKGESETIHTFSILLFRVAVLLSAHACQETLWLQFLEALSISFLCGNCTAHIAVPLFTFIHFFWPEGVPGAKIYWRRLSQLKGTVLPQQSLHKWIEQFKNYCTSIEHKKGAGSPFMSTANNDNEQVSAMILSSGWIFRR